MIRTFYKFREKEEIMDFVIMCCKKQIELSEKAAISFRTEDRNYNEMPEDMKPYFYEDHLKELERIKIAPLPSHVGYKQLAIIEEKRGNYEEAIRISMEANKTGWNDDWQGRIERLKKRIANKYKKGGKAFPCRGSPCL
jgi:hypothetical protein